MFVQKSKSIKYPRPRLNSGTDTPPTMTQQKVEVFTHTTQVKVLKHVIFSVMRFAATAIHKT